VSCFCTVELIRPVPCYFTDCISVSFAFRDIALIANSRFNALLFVVASSWQTNTTGNRLRV
jgi:hypothetical protein